MKPLCCIACLTLLVAGCAESRIITAPVPATIPASEPPSSPASPPTQSKPVPVKKDPPLPPPPPPPVLSPQVTQQEEERLRQKATAKIDRAEEIVKQIDQTKLAKERQDTLSTVQSFLAKAREAMSARDLQKAYTLADKAQLLAEELIKK